MKKQYVIVAVSGSFIGVDYQTGGYPDLIPSEFGLGKVSFWNNQVEAQTYADLWKDSSMKEWRGMVVKEFQYTLSDPI